MMANAIKRKVRNMLLWAGAGAAARMLHRGRAVILAYHNIVPDDAPPCGEMSLHLVQRRFERQLDLVSRTHAVVPLYTLLESRVGSDRPKAAITFDDAYVGAVAIGIPQVVRRGLSATIFVAPGLLEGRSFWWDELASSGPARTVPPSAREHALNTLRGEAEAIRRWARQEGLALQRPGGHAVAATCKQLKKAAAEPGVTLGSHTWSHPNLTALNQKEMKQELEAPLAWLQERFANVIPWLAYPFGLTSPEVAEAAASAGYTAAVDADGGWLPPEIENRHTVPRMCVSANLSDQGFESRLSGLTGAR